MSRAGWGLLVGLLALGVTPSVEAQPVSGALDAKVAQSLERARSDRGVGAYVALRELWKRWDQVDPSFVTEAFGLVEADTGVDGPVRAYAGMLGAYAQRRRGDLDGARRKLRSLGFLDHWLVVGPFDNEAKGSLFTRFGPEEELTGAIVAGKGYEGKERPVLWRALPPGSFGWLDLGNVMRPSEKVCAYATTFLRSVPAPGAKEKDAKAPERRAESRPVTLWMGASGSFRAFWNGEEVLTDVEYRALDADRFSARVNLKGGWNRLTVKVCGDEEGPMLQARLADEQGRPGVVSFEASADPVLAAEAQVNAVTPAKPAETTRRQGVTTVKGDPYAGGATGHSLGKLVRPAGGPLVAIGKVLNEKNTPPAQLEASARYLAQTGGDPRGQHLARDLAIRAAEAEPTVPRLLLAADLAEDRNARAAWIVRARALNPTGADDIEVTLAEGLLARGGTNFRDATPFFEKILGRDPGHIAATLGKAELYEEAGLRRSALSVLEEGIRRTPHSVALLRALAHQYRLLGRVTEAEEVERRYANLRFDDVTYLRSQIELAVARRDVAAGTRWVERLIELDPESFGSIEAAARAFRALGQQERAVATLQRRLDIAPDDTDALRSLAEMQGEDGKRDEQVKLLRRVLALRPQSKDVREYLEHMQPTKARRDEAFAVEKDALLALAKQPLPAGGFPRRTLRDLQVTTVYPNGLASRFHQVVFQPLTDEGAAQSRQYAFAFQAGRDVVDLRAARVYRADGKVDEAVETGEGPSDSPELAMYSSTRMFYVQLPRLNVGDVVELRYRVEEVIPRNDFGDTFSETTFLQSTEPVASADYVLITPKERKVQLHVPNLPGLTRSEREDGDVRIAQLGVKDMAPLRSEPLMPPPGELAAVVNASTFATWNDVGAWFWGLSKDQFDADAEVRKKALEITQGKTDELEKVRAVYDYVVQRTRYVALEFGIDGFRPRRCAQTLARGWGDCKDKATVLVTLLRELGIEAHFVLIRTRLRGDATPEPPSYAFFDHAIAYVPKFDLFLDGTAEYTGMNELPAFDRQALGLIVKPGGEAKLVRLPDPAADLTLRKRQIELTVPENGPSTIDAKVETTGAIASEWRQRFHALATQRARVTEELGAEFGGLTLAPGAAGLDVSDLENVEQPVKLRFRGKSSSMSRTNGGDLAFSIAPLSSLVASFASLSSRQQDIRLPFAHGYDDEWTVRVPAGHVVRQTPTEAHVQSPYGRLDLTSEQAGGRAVVKVKLRFDKTRIPASEYPAFRTFCEQVDRALGERVVLGVK